MRGFDTDRARSRASGTVHDRTLRMPPPSKAVPGSRRAAWLLLACALLCGPAHAEMRVYLIRGWFGVFSTGLDRIAADLRAKGIQAEPIAHLQWRATASAIISERSRGGAGALVLVGHSQGGNDAIKLARELEPHGVTVDLLIALAPFLQDPVPSNVKRAINYYQSGGWGSPLTAAPGLRADITNVDMGSDAGTFHINIDKNPAVQARVVEAIVALAQKP
jgi:hypothetical protein